MISKISQQLRQTLNQFPQEQDQIIFQNQLHSINPQNFQPLPSPNSSQTISFVDGGQAEILSAANFCLSFIRVFAITFQQNKKISSQKNEFYLLTTAIYQDNQLSYQSQIFPLTEKLINEQDLFISSQHQTIQTSLERAPISKVTNIARRFAELALATRLDSDFIILDGTLQPTFLNEEKYLSTKLSALAKSSSLFTSSGNSPHIILNQLGPTTPWNYQLTDQTSFVKLHQNSKHVFRFEGNHNSLPLLAQNSHDSLFLGYPYGLLLADKFARISHQEKNSLKTQFLLKKENKFILDYLTTTNAHDILDNLS